MFVFGRGVIEVFGGEDERGEEDPVDGTTHAFCYWGEALLEAREVDEGAH